MKIKSKQQETLLVVQSFQVLYYTGIITAKECEKIKSRFYKKYGKFLNSISHEKNNSN